MKALQNENRLDIDNANIDKNSNSAVADKLTAKDTSILLVHHQTSLKSKTAKSFDQVPDPTSSGNASKK